MTSRPNTVWSLYLISAALRWFTWNCCIVLLDFTSNADVKSAEAFHVNCLRFSNIDWHEHFWNKTFCNMLALVQSAEDISTNTSRDYWKYKTFIFIWEFVDHGASSPSFILNLRLGSLPNHFLYRPSPFLPDWFHGLTDHLTFYSAQRLDLFAQCVRLSRLLVGFRTHFKSLHFHSFIHFIPNNKLLLKLCRSCVTMQLTRYALLHRIIQPSTVRDNTGNCDTIQLSCTTLVRLHGSLYRPNLVLYISLIRHQNSNTTKSSKIIIITIIK